MEFLVLLPLLAAAYYFIGKLIFLWRPSFRSVEPLKPIPNVFDGEFWRKRTLVRDFTGIAIALLLFELLLSAGLEGLAGMLTVQALIAYGLIVVPAFVAWQMLYERETAPDGGRTLEIALVFGALAWVAVIAAAWLYRHG